MKKLMMILAVAVSLAMVSACGQKATESADEVTKQLQELVEKNDVQGIEDLQKEAAKAIEKLEAAGKTEEAEVYKSKIKEFVESNKEKLQNMSIADIVEAAKDVEGTAEGLAEEGEAAVKADAEHAKEEAKAKAKEKANEAIDKASADIEQKLDEAAAKAKEDLKNRLQSNK
ncbi:MAG: lipoprotein [Muribaculaceae bacterium]